MNKLVMLENNIPITTSKIISMGVNVKHKNVIELIERHKQRIEKLRGVLPFQTEKPKKGSKGGRPESYYLLNELQATFLITLMKNSDIVLDFKENLVKQFILQKQWILEQKTQKQNQQYIETRNQSKIGRKHETDIIKIFVEYAKKQGSKSADKYYMAISKMENQAFFILKEKFPNVREILNIQQLSKIIVADMIVKTAIIEGMEKEMKYKDIFQLAKKRVVEMSNSLGFKEILPGIERKEIE